ncbi:hypothetical protein [Pyrodictium abyssi]|uniref:DUF5678 domain-containing protein n=1 Tax=Pyrodictium abyssi TaxID=54256 RepID=A0ABM8IW89_9CREN|nr:hypothetical protein PABY_13870 [Pyrodictium abyssi]
MAGSRSLRRTRLVAVKNFDEELYRLVKAYASLEGRTVTSIFEEAVRLWIESRGDYEEARLWARLEQAYQENLRVLEENPQLLEGQKGYALLCNGRLVGVYPSHEEAAAASRRECRDQALIIQLPRQGDGRRVELGLPW